MTTLTQTQWEYLVVPLPEAKGLKKALMRGIRIASMRLGRRVGKRSVSRLSTAISWRGRWSCLSARWTDIGVPIGPWWAVPSDNCHGPIWSLGVTWSPTLRQDNEGPAVAEPSSALLPNIVIRRGGSTGSTP